MFCLCATLTKAVFVYLCICVFVFGSQVSGGGWVDSGCHKLSENIWFVWSKMSYSGDMEGCHACARTDGRTTECEDRARILETEFAQFTAVYYILEHTNQIFSESL